MATTITLVTGTGSATYTVITGARGPAGADGATGPAGSDANVTNANVNAAIDDDPASSLYSLGFFGVFPQYADLAAANAVLPIGVVFYNTATSRYEVTTA